ASNFSTPLFDDSTLTQTSQQIGPLAYSTVYYWRVNAKNSGGTSSWSTVSRFTTTSPAIPPGPQLSSPPSGSLNQPTSVTLFWNAAIGATSYHLQLSANADFSVLTVDDSTITDTSRQVGPLGYST